MQPFVVVGDKTDHGGVVLEGAPTTDTGGKRIARVGDKVSCPQKGHGGTTVIVSGDPTMLIDGKPAARHGDKCACGATLIASQAVSFVSTGGGGGSTSRASSAAAAASALAAFDEQVQLENVVFAEGLHYFIKAGSNELTGRVGPDGRLPRVSTSREDEYEVLVGDEALARIEGLAS